MANDDTQINLETISHETWSSNYPLGMRPPPSYLRSILTPVTLIPILSWLGTSLASAIMTNYPSGLLEGESGATAGSMDSESIKFGPYKIDPKEVFYATQLSYALVNLRPVVPDLTADEVSDLWLSAQKIGSRLETYHKASSLTYAIQDGPQAGQTVPHVHIHILPRKNGDFEKNDEIYDAIDLKEKELKQNLDLDKERKDRSMEEMAEEADSYRKLLL
ncbi:FRAGILE HISTIDINE TRIAD [Striga hermonthica]|uniref:Bis(5'-adenosyl)-triphosphatase n=1 Tax=Striga hermonthica TaxID=68872 RepID=A0A9N7NQJ5_STRHE|nr:FRAGILE HISTIDINE TRIAD [Striga hermonthica]